MKNNLYYTPTLENLHYGFEFEYKSKDDNWIKVTLDTWNNPSKDNHLKYFTEYDLLRTLNHQDMACKYENLTCIRVKYLDQSDIESLGWKLYSQELTNRSNWCCFRNTQLEMYIQLDNNYFPRLLNFKSRGGDHIGNFKIKIKNKSELIKLMQQLNIK